MSGLHIPKLVYFQLKLLLMAGALPPFYVQINRTHWLADSKPLFSFAYFYTMLFTSFIYNAGVSY